LEDTPFTSRVLNTSALAGDPTENHPSASLPSINFDSQSWCQQENKKEIPGGISFLFL